MGKLKDTVLILGEGPTEFYYFNSIRDVIKGLTIRPDYPKHTSIKELEEKIENGMTTFSVSWTWTQKTMNRNGHNMKNSKRNM